MMGSPSEPQLITSLEEFMERVCSIKKPGKTGAFLYRGQSDSNWPLLARIFRKNTRRDCNGRGVEYDPKEGPGDEKKMLDCFRSESRIYGKTLEHVPANDFEWLAIAQHLEMPTRLLDFTLNPLVALWFAVKHMGDTNEDNRFRCPAVLVIPTPQALSESDMTECDPLELKEPRSFSAVGLHSRATAQSSVHIVQPSSVCELTSVERIIIHRPSEGKLKGALRDIGINYGALYPGVEGVARDLAWRYKWKRLD